MKENNENSTHNLDELKESVWTKCVTNEDISILERCFKETCKCTSDDYGSCTYDYSSASSFSDDCCKDNTTYKPFQTHSCIVSFADTGSVERTSNDTTQTTKDGLKVSCNDHSTCSCDSESTENSIHHKTTDEQFTDALNMCRDIFSKKLHDYGASWRIMRPQSVTDQIYIKANRIRSIEESGISLVGEPILPEFMAIVNYGIVGLIQLELGYSNTGYDLCPDDALRKYDEYAQFAYELMTKKNHDYNEAWRLMRIHSYTDFILMKICRTKQLESLGGKSLVSEGIDANYLDMINYAIFGIIKMTEMNQI